jgi:hypothetical protein
MLTGAMRILMTLLFATTGGLALSGIVANLYRMLARKPKGTAERLCYLGVMTMAGPSVLIDNATRSFRRNDCSNGAYAFAVGLTTYWSFTLGWLLIALEQRL